MELNRVYQRLLKAWAVYLSRLVSADAPFDRYARGDDHALSDPQRRGLSLFIGKAGCIECHKGPMFSDNRFASVGIGQVGVNVGAEDKGRAAGREASRYWQTPLLQLRPGEQKLPSQQG